MIYKIFIGILLLSTLIYYVFCFLEIFEVIKFTDDETEVKIPQMFIPFYYLFKKGNKNIPPVLEDDHVEEQPIQAVPEQKPKPKRNSKGQYEKQNMKI